MIVIEHFIEVEKTRFTKEDADAMELEATAEEKSVGSLASTRDGAESTVPSTGGKGAELPEWNHGECVEGTVFVYEFTVDGL